MANSTTTNLTSNSTTAIFLSEDDFMEDPNETAHQEHISTYLIYRLTLHCISLVADAVIIYAIYRFKALRTYENNFILHRSIFNVVHIVFTAFIHLVWLQIIEAPFLPCYLSVTSSTLLLMTLLLPYGMFFSWIVHNFKYKLFESYEMTCRRYLIYLVYLMGVIEYILEYLSCHFELFHMLASTFEIIILCTITMNIVKHKFCLFHDKAVSTLYTIHVANVVIFSFLPMLIYHHFINYLQVIEYVYFFIVTRFIPDFVALTNSVWVLLVLYRFNKDFENAFVIIWRTLLRKEHGDIRWININNEEH